MNLILIQFFSLEKNLILQIENQKIFSDIFLWSIPIKSPKFACGKNWQTLKARGGSAQELFIRCKEAEEYLNLYQSVKHQIVLLPKQVIFSSDTIITKQKIFLIGYGQEDVVGTEIWNEELAQTQSTLFDLLWTSCPIKKT